MVVIRSRVQWKRVWDKYTRQLLQAIWKMNINSIILKLKNRKEEVVNQMKELENIFFEFYNTLYQS